MRIVCFLFECSENDPSYLQETTAQKFYLVVNLVQKRPVDELVGRLRKGKMITKERVIETSTSPQHFCNIPVLTKE